MDALSTYLNAYNRKEKLSKFEEELSLPKIPEKPHQSAPKTSLNNRIKKNNKKDKGFVSETTLSPEQ